MRKPLVVANWKMNKVRGEVSEFVQLFKRKLPHGTVGKVDVAICPAFVHLGGFTGDGMLPIGVGLGAQDVHWQEKGAFTGCISPGMLKDLKVRYAIIGHSERRQYFGESSDMLAAKCKAALQFALAPIFCVGERLEQREGGKTFDVLKDQMTALEGLREFLPSDPSAFILAYEPVWAIGTGKNATVDQAQEAHRFLRQILATMWDEERAQATRLLYGGSVTPENFGELLGASEIDGGLVGGASLDPEKFLKLIEIAVG